MTDASSVIIPAISGLVGAIIGGFLTVWGSIKAVAKASQNLESMEIRRQKIECIVALYGLRWVLESSTQRSEEYKEKTSYELNKIAALWADDSEVMRNLRDYYDDPKSIQRLIVLLRSLDKNTKLSTGNLSDTEMKNIFYIK